MIVWRGAVSEVHCSASVLAEIGELAMSGYRRFPWGGVEIGGVLFGKNDSRTVHISSFRAVECEHHYGPAFDFTTKDSEALERLLAAAASDEKLSGLLPVGWYQTVSRRELTLSEYARALFHRFFPESWQVTVVVKRSKQDPLSIGVFVRDSHGRVEMHSSPQEFTLESLKERQSRLTVPDALPSQGVAPANSTTDSRTGPPLPSQLVKPPGASTEHALSQERSVLRANPLESTRPHLSETREGSTESGSVVASSSEEPLDLQSKAQEARSHVEPELLAEPSVSDTPFSFFGLTANPFGAHPDARFFYPSLQHREALAVLSHRIRGHAGFIVMLGEPGTGKSIVLECLKDLLKASETHFSYLLNSKIGVAEFFELIAHDFRLPCVNPTKTATLIALNEYLLTRSRAGQTTALVVDSAEKLSTELLEEIELLGNLENRDGQLLQVVFAAQPSFERLLEAPELRSLKQRLVSRAQLEPLDLAQAAAYIEHRMAKAGAKGHGVFDADVVAEIHRRTHGVPRLINALCGRLLASCREFQVKTADVRMLEPIEDGSSALPPKWEPNLWTA